jgi:hypothetical protein
MIQFPLIVCKNFEIRGVCGSRLMHAVLLRQVVKPGQPGGKTGAT